MRSELNFNTIKEKLLKNRKKLDEFKIDSIYLFGSIIKGTFDEDSDIDFLVKFKQPVSIFTFIDLKDYLENLFGRNIDLVPYDSIKKQLRDRILGEAKFAA